MWSAHHFIKIPKLSSLSCHYIYTFLSFTPTSLLYFTILFYYSNHYFLLRNESLPFFLHTFTCIFTVLFLSYLTPEITVTPVILSLQTIIDTFGLSVSYIRSKIISFLFQPISNWTLRKETLSFIGAQIRVSIIEIFPYYWENNWLTHSVSSVCS